MAMSRLVECHDEGEFLIIKSLLDGNDIVYCVQNEHFGSLYPGASLPFNGRVILVHDEELGRAQTLLSKLHDSNGGNEAG